MGNKFAGQVVIVTGASSGIGRAAALIFAKEGAKLVIAARRKERLETLAEEIISLGGQALVVPVDLSQEGAAKELMAKTIEHYSTLNVLVNNAGYGLQIPVEHTSLQDARRIFEVNVLAVVEAIQTAIPHLKKTQGTIVNVASIVGLIPMPLQPLYTSTKYALVGLNRSMAYELKSTGINMVTVCPGPVKTEFLDVISGKKFPKWLIKYSGVFMDTAETIAKTVVRAATKKRSKVMYGSFRSRMAVYSFLMCKPVADWLYSVYIGQMKKQHWSN